MAEIVNLRRARKARDRAEAAKNAAANRHRHGRDKAARAADAAADASAARAAHRLDGHRLAKTNAGETESADRPGDPDRDSRD